MIPLFELKKTQLNKVLNDLYTNDYETDKTSSYQDRGFVYGIKDGFIYLDIHSLDTSCSSASDNKNFKSNIISNAIIKIGQLSSRFEIQQWQTDLMMRTAAKAQKRPNTFITKKEKGLTIKMWYDDSHQRLNVITECLGKGSFSKVYEIMDLATGAVKAFKKLRNKGFSLEELKRIQGDIRNEYAILTRIHQNGRIWGIQAPPIQFVEINPKNSKKGKKIGFIGQEYEGNYCSHIMGSGQHIKNVKNTPLIERLPEFHQLLAGLSFLSRNNYLHGDIKPENILSTPNSGQFPYVHIGDMGSVCKVQNSTSIEDLFRACTPGYIIKRELLENQELGKQNHRNQLIAREKSRDVFAMGVVLYEALMGYKPYHLDTEGFLEDSSSMLPIDRPDVPRSLQNLIKRMVSRNPNLRPTATEAFNEFEVYIKTAHPDLFEQLYLTLHQESFNL